MVPVLVYIILTQSLAHPQQIKNTLSQVIFAAFAYSIKPPLLRQQGFSVIGNRINGFNLCSSIRIFVLSELR